MMNRIYVVIFILGLFCFGTMQSLYAQEEKGVVEPLTGVVELIKNGDWQSALNRARELVAQDAGNASVQYVADMAAIVLGDHTNQMLSEYDFPYSDKQAMRDVELWAENLLENQPDNINILMLNGMLHSPKGDSNISKFREYFEQA